MVVLNFYLKPRKSRSKIRKIAVVWVVSKKRFLSIYEMDGTVYTT